MATSPNFSWPEPDNTDLVKNGALAIRTAVNAIDSSLAELKGGTTGQVLSKTSNTDMDFTWVAQDDSNAIQNAIVDAKGDLIAATANDTPARLAVGANDLVLTAASGEATGLKYTGGYTSWTPTWSGLTVGNGTVTARYTQVGKTVRFDMQLLFGSTTSITTSYPSFTLPVALAKTSVQCAGFWIDSGTAKYFNSYYLDNANLVFFITTNVAGTYPSEAGISPTVPFTWTTNDIAVVSGSYEVA